ncbi:MAG TPA: HigA family addiction module antitoxin [Oculatellaceae cyanobacterium]
MNISEQLQPLHPGEILKEEFLVPMGMTANQLAMRLQVPPGRITGIINGQRSVTPDTALRLSKFFGNSAEFWMNLQMHYDLQLASQESKDRINREVRPVNAD